MASMLDVALLHRAAEVLGGQAKLRGYLRVSARDLEQWMAGDERMPRFVFLKLVDVVGEDATARLIPDAGANGLGNGRAASSVWLEPIAGEGVLAVAPRARALGEFIEAEFSAGQIEELMAWSLNAAVANTGAARGNVQIVEGNNLRLVAQLGFEQPFIDFFSVVDAATPSACGAAHSKARRVVVKHVPSDPIFKGTPAEDVMLGAGALACQSTPLVDGSGAVFGMLSTHYDQAHEPTPRELKVIDTVAARMSYRLAGGNGRAWVAAHPEP